MAKLTRKPVFWIAHVLFFLICLFYTWKNFYRAFPFVQLDVRMDRRGAMKAAADLAQYRNWSPVPIGGQPSSGATAVKEGNLPYRQAVSFDVDSSTQNFIELEAGGPAALTRVLKEGIFTPYVWQVRHFQEAKTNETQIRFTPEGQPYGFSEKISEDDPGPALSSERAQAIAEKAAVGEWNIDFTAYRLAEKSQEVRRSKRVDHSFIYEREKEKVGEGRYRLKLVVSGDHLSELTRFIKIPDAFFRRYSSMRAANGTIATLAFAAIVLLYGIGACGMGLFLLARAHWVQWRMPLIVASVIAGLQFLDALNRMPLEWMNYDTAISAQAFQIRQLAQALFGSFFELIVLAIPIMAAESLTRRAFPNHPQFWRIFSRDAAFTKSVLGRVAGAYLAVGFHFAFVMWIYQMGEKHLGWWNPSELLFHPDALATYFPWLTSISSSLHAGLWEECLFRAVPLASAALLGNRFGHRGKWIAGAFILQAVIFGAGHATYPTQPSYARVIELIVPSFVFGGTYLVFGLLPGIIMHFTYDVILFAMPLFLSTGSQAWASQSIVVVLSLLPLWIVLLARVRAGRWGELSADLWNRAWTPPVRPIDSPRETNQLAARLHLSVRVRPLILTAGLASLGVWAGLAQFKTDAPGLQVDRDSAIALSRKTLADRGVKLGAEWQVLASTEGGAEEEDLFVWKTSGRDAYRNLMGSYLAPPRWKIRFARFEGDLAERADEYQVFVTGSGEVYRVRHELPESRGGAVLEEGRAREIALKVVRERFGLDPARLKEISSNQFKLPARRDWLFVWTDPTQSVTAGETGRLTLKEGEARLAVKISGDEVVGERRLIEVPEEWRRKERNRKTTMGVISSLGMIFLALLALGVTFSAIHGWIRGHFSLKAFGVAAGVLLFLSITADFNAYPIAMAGFSTAQSLSSQFVRLLTREGVLVILMSILPALWVGAWHAEQASPTAKRVPAGSIWLGYAVGAILAAGMAGVGRIGHSIAPTWPDVTGAGLLFPAWGGVESLGGIIMQTAFLGLLFSRISHKISQPVWKGVLFLLTGLALSAIKVDESLWVWCGAGVAIAVALTIVSIFFERTSPVLVVPLIGLIAVLTRAHGLVSPGYVGAIPAHAIAVVVIGAVSWVWFGALNGRGGVEGA